MHAGLTLALAIVHLAAPAFAEPTLTKVASFDHQVTGVAVTPDGRIFVNFPRWTEDSPISVAEVKGGALVPFPDAEWNAWRNATKDQMTANDHWVCVQSVVTDAQGNLWVLDPAAPAQERIVENGPKLVRIDLATNTPDKIIAFDETIAPQGSYLDDVRVSPDGKTAYITDAGARGALVVVDIATGRARRILDGDPSTQPDPNVTVMADGRPLRRSDGRRVELGANGIALSRDGQTLYWQAIQGATLYSIPTANIESAEPQRAGENGVADGLWIARDGQLYITALEEDAIKVRDLTVEHSEPTTLLADERLRWPDSFAEGADGTLYVTTSRIQDSATFKPGAPTALPTELWKITGLPTRIAER